MMIALIISLAAGIILLLAIVYKVDTFSTN